MAVDLRVKRGRVPLNSVAKRKTRAMIQYNSEEGYVAWLSHKILATL